MTSPHSLPATVANAAAYRPSADAVVVASVSGGKDSTAMVLHLLELGITPRLVFFDTGWEHADTYAHLDYLEAALDLPIERLSYVVTGLTPAQEAAAVEVEELLGVSPSAFVRLCIQKGIFPRRTVRFCTQTLKMYQAQGTIRQEHEAGRTPVNAIGIRAAESKARAKLPPIELSLKLDCMVWRPILTWTEADVIAIHGRHNVRPNPLYLAGAARVGCFPCIMARKAQLRMVGRDERRMAAIRHLERVVRGVYHDRCLERDGETPTRLPTMFTAVRRDADGDRPGVLIDDAVRHANTADGAAIEQGNLFDEPEDPDAGCLRWGLCDHPEEDGA